jgi:uncharacterized Zn finger protein (UPF0148 family)
MTQLHCPKCGARLERNARGALECRAGQMEISRILEERLTECYVDESRAPRERRIPVTAAIGRSWFCPACGVPTTEATSGDVRCPRCARSLSEFLYHLIEFHPHREGGAWSSGWF